MNATKEKGSLQAAQAIAASIKTLLGSSNTAKCCINDEDDVIICRSTAKILQYLEVEHPVGYIVNDACQSMYTTHGCGCTTLVCMIGFWSRSALALQHEGVPVSIICQLFDEALFKCIQVLDEIAVPMQEALGGRSKVSVNPSIPCSTASISSMFLFEKVWLTSEDDIFNKTDTSYTSDDALLTSNSSVILSLGIGDHKNLKHETNRVTQNIVANFPDNSKTQNTKKLTAASQHYSVDQGNSLKESSKADKEVEDEFECCFDDAPVKVETCSRTRIRKVTTDVCRSLNSKQVDLSKGSLSTLNMKQKSNKSFENSELKTLEHMLKDLSFLGQKSTKASTAGNVSEILKSCHNLSVDSPKTQLQVEAYQTQEVPALQAGSRCINITRANFERLGEMLSHGKDKEMVLAVEVLFNQISSKGKKHDLNRFEVDKNTINIEKVVGPTSDHSQVVAGILLRQKAQLIGHLKPGAVHVAMVNGDVTEEFRHVGFKDSFQTKRILNKDSYKNLQGNNISWLQRILKVIVTLNIGVIVARGNIDKDVADSCQTLNIKTFSNIPSRTLQILSHSLCATAVVYLLDLKASHIGRPVFLRHWNGPHPGRNGEDDYFVVLELTETQATNNTLHQCGNKSHGLRENRTDCDEDKGLLQTVLLCAPSEQLFMDLELAFWNCIFRLRNTTNCDLVLPGAGRTELACIRKLGNLPEYPDLHYTKPKYSSWLQASLPSYRTAVYTAFADGLVEFLISVLSNSGQMMNYGQAHTDVHQSLSDYNQPLLGHWLVADDFIAKRNAWRKAVGVVCLMLQSDVTVVTGILD